ncbi:MAG: C-GCAxxG-C-C family protein [Bacteroidales bacterium]|jgi:C_GCAxxG_C_C family probable redox protein|nr:C-GCAxxG-C-C family protein [Bacteroidales bacterium]
MTRTEKALEYFSNGFNCSQSVIVSFADILKIDEKTALRIASGFGGGMGGMQETCGAVTGAFMVIGYLKGKYKDGDDETKELTNKLIQEFTQKFVEKFGEINCKALINVDFNTEEGKKQAEELDVFNKKCTTFINHSVDLLEEMLITHN